LGELIPFRMPKIKMTAEETREYHELLRKIESAKTLRDIRICNKETKEFMKRLKQRTNREM